MSDHHRKLERMYLAAPISQVYAPAIEIDKGTATIAVDVNPRFYHAAHALHGSVYFKLLDDACFFAVSSIVEDVFVLTTSFTIYMTRPVSSGRIVASGRVVHSGKNVFLGEAELANDEGKIIGRGNGAFMKSRTPLAPDIGYA
jgi:uncharacterized protein (TIGR00369 family)